MIVSAIRVIVIVIVIVVLMAVTVILGRFPRRPRIC
jgi:hypothetical protein